jgi:multiple sugar transport system substrate-binding protein
VPAGEIKVQFETRGGVLEQEVMGAVSALTSQNPAAKISIADAPAGSYLTELTLALMSGTAPDVFAGPNIATGQLASLGAIIPIDNFLASWADWGQFPDIVKQNLAFQGQNWGLPNAIDTHFVYYRKDLFQAAGLPVPWQPQTLDDITAAARAIKQSSPDVIPLVLFAGANPGNSTAIRGFLPLLRAYGGTLKDGDGKWIIDSCAVRGALGYYELVYQTEQLVPQSVMTSVDASDAMREAFAAGEAAIMFDGSWVWDDWTEKIPNLTETVGYVLHPPADGSAPFTIGGFGDTWFINARTASPDLAWAFVAAMNGMEMITNINLDDPHIPPRQDSMADPRFQDGAFLQAMVESLAVSELNPPDPAYQQLVGIIQNATGLVATGETTSNEAVERYAEELTRVLGEGNVVKQACP